MSSPDDANKEHDSDLNKIAETLLGQLFSEKFKEEWKLATKQAATPRRGLRRTVAMLCEHTDALILRRFKSEVCLEDYFSDSPPAIPDLGQVLQRGSSPTVSIGVSNSHQKSKILARIERSTISEEQETFGTSVSLPFSKKLHHRKF